MLSPCADRHRTDLLLPFLKYTALLSAIGHVFVPQKYVELAYGFTPMRYTLKLFPVPGVYLFLLAVSLHILQVLAPGHLAPSHLIETKQSLGIGHEEPAHCKTLIALGVRSTAPSVSTCVRLRAVLLCDMSYLS